MIHANCFIHSILIFQTLVAYSILLIGVASPLDLPEGFTPICEGEDPICGGSLTTEELEKLKNNANIKEQEPRQDRKGVCWNFVDSTFKAENCKNFEGNCNEGIQPYAGVNQVC